MTSTRLPVADRRDVRRATWRLLSGDRRALTTVLALYCAAAAAGLAGPWIVGRIIDQVESGTTTSTIDVLAATACAFVITQVLFTRAARYAGHRFGERALARLRERFLDDVLDLPVATVEHAGTGDLMTRASSDVATVGNSARDALPEIFLGFVQMVFIAGALFVLDPILGLCALISLPALTLVTRWYLRRARDAYLAEGAANTELAEDLAATAEGARTVEILRMRAGRITGNDERIGAAFATRVRTLWLRSVLFPSIDIAHTLPVAATLLIGGALYLNDQVSLGTVAAATLYLWQLVEPINAVVMWIEALQAGSAAFARIEGVGKVPPATPPSGRVPHGDLLDIDDVHYAYHAGHDVLRGVSLSVRPGERLAIVGPSGAGKSTLGRLLAGIDAPSAGRITIGGVDATDLDATELRRRVALVTQDHHIFLGTLRDNLALAAPDADDARMFTALEAVGATWPADLPAGLDTMLGSGGMQPDASQSQQLALARLVLADPHTLILDEATSMLDPRAARDAERSLAAVLEGRTVIAIAHRLHTAHDADRVAVMENGVVTELGSHDELAAAGGTYASLWRSWHGG
ncbi:ABC transporter ATP-binding protein [Phytomonospora endophytica]|uniref:ATP-binding cassette subfamily C protein n=1 Tax=Phytomonospora endophytica TaxID=714109 RepID=A0A841FE39_9ACTN|nr:ABC transporter ATP-binding protein [Phytomonospora endophytica]MBB6033775.1 ATP-binding cassette subfamily C protein [Phytomonospora endophytica]GIG64707.1 multidrug ABC transporter ATP-binding protein [Phytomonospora endophytica]